MLLIGTTRHLDDAKGRISADRYCAVAWRNLDLKAGKSAHFVCDTQRMPPKGHTPRSGPLFSGTEFRELPSHLKERTNLNCLLHTST